MPRVKKSAPEEKNESLFTDSDLVEEVEEDDVSSTLGILQGVSDTEKVEPDVSISAIPAGAGIALETVPVKSFSQVDQIRSDTPKVRIICLADIEPPPHVAGWRFPDGFKYRKNAQAMVPQPVGVFLAEKDVAAVLR